MLRLLILWALAGVLGAADGPAFDVASIHPHPPGDSGFRAKMPNDGQFSATGIPLRLLLMLAYDVPETQIEGGPDWTATEKWDIEAKSERRGSSAEETRRMLQNLLADRFGLRVRRETQPRPAYTLTVARRGPKFEAVKQPGSTNLRPSPNGLRVENGSMAQLVQMLGSAMGRPVVDRTGLTETYTLSVQWDDAPVAGGVLPGAGEGAAGPGWDFGLIFTAFEEQLGLRLEAATVPVAVVVVDGVERPTGN